MTRRLLIFTIILGAVVVFLGGWWMVYPSPADPKNMKYVLWKAGLCRIDLDIATEAMVGDSGRDRLVLGRTDQELRKRFGFLLEPSEASPYLRTCYQTSPWKGSRVLFIRSSSWMVVFDGGRAANLVLVKGC